MRYFSPNQSGARTDRRSNTLSLSSHFLGFSKGKMSKGSGDSVQAAQSSGSRSDLSSPSVGSAKSSSRGGLASVARLVKLGRCKNVVVVAGAGISTASGIPDFRLVSF